MKLSINRYLPFGARGVLTAALGILSLVGAPVLFAQATTSTYPNKPIRFVVPYAPGGFPDTVARLLSQRLSDKLGQQVVVENRPGANGLVAAQTLAASPADGYTLMVTDGSIWTINPLLYKNLPYNPSRDFLPVAMAARAPLFLAAHPSTPVKTFQELIDYVKARPGKLDYASSGIGSTHHLTMEAIKSALRLHLVHVPYRGTGQSVPALVGGQVGFTFSALPSLQGFVKDGRLKLLAVNSLQRSSLAPELPAISEFIPGFDFAPMVGVFAPTGTPAAVIERIALEVGLLTKSPELAQAFARVGIDPLNGGPAQFRQALDKEGAVVAATVKSAGITAE
jgi:tripartite-type tricarboxylate transporter receptor subunit TctC